MHSCVIFLLSLCLSLNALIIDYSFDQILMGVASKFRNKCAHIGSNTSFVELQVATLDLNDCITINFGSPDTVCTEQRTKSYNCYEEFFDKLEQCLEPQEMYFRSLILNTHNATFEKVCENGGKNFILKKSKFDSVTCSKPTSSILSEFIQDCAPKLHIVRNLYKKDDVIMESDFCQDIETLSTCHADQIKKYCEDYQDIKDFLDFIFDEYLSSCAKDLMKN